MKLRTGPLSEESQYLACARHMAGVITPWNGTLAGGTAHCGPASSPEMSSFQMCKSLRFPAPKGRTERTPSPLPLGLSREQATPASSGFHWRHLQNSKTVSGMLGLSGECQGWGTGGEAVGSLCGAKTTADILAGD